MVDPVLGVHGRVVNRFTTVVYDSVSRVFALVGSAHMAVKPMLGMDSRVMNGVLGMHRGVVGGLVVLGLLDAKRHHHCCQGRSQK